MKKPIIEIKEVTTVAMMKQFIKFPLKLYRGVKQFVPPLFGDELKLFGDKNPNNDTSDSVFFLAYQNKKIVGRISGIIQHDANKKNNEKRARFTRFDAINDIEVARALFDSVENWAKEKGMNKMCGPLDYNDLGREGLLVEGFDQIATFEEQYNYSYYQNLIETQGYKKEIDWLEFKLSYPNEENVKLKRIADKILSMNKLHQVDSSKFSKKDYINKYKDGFFKCLDECYRDLYGTVEIDEESKKSLIDQFMLLINKKYLVFICDETEKVVAFGLCFPSISKPFKRSGGRITPLTLLKLLHAVNHPKVIDLGLVGVLPQYQGKGVNAVILQSMMTMLKDIDYAETNLNLEYNHQVMDQWKYFNSVQHKRRRSFLKELK